MQIERQHLLGTEPRQRKEVSQLAVERQGLEYLEKQVLGNSVADLAVPRLRRGHLYRIR